MNVEICRRSLLKLYFPTEDELERLGLLPDYWLFLCSWLRPMRFHGTIR